MGRIKSIRHQVCNYRVSHKRKKEYNMGYADFVLKNPGALRYRLSLTDLGLSCCFRFDMGILEHITRFGFKSNQQLLIKLK